MLLYQAVWVVLGSQYRGVRGECGSFSDCVNLCSINVDGNNDIYSSEDGVLFNKEMTTLLCFPEGKGGTYNIPKSVTSVEIWAFSDCVRLNCVNVPDQVTSIGSSAFWGWTSSQTINFQIAEADKPSGWSSLWDAYGGATVNWGVEM